MISGPRPTSYFFVTAGDFLGVSEPPGSSERFLASDFSGLLRAFVFCSDVSADCFSDFSGVSDFVLIADCASGSFFVAGRAELSFSPACPSGFCLAEER